MAWSRLYHQRRLSFLEARDDYGQRLLILEIDCKVTKQIALKIVGGLVELIHGPLMCSGRIYRSLYPAKVLKLWSLAIIFHGCIRRRSQTLFGLTPLSCSNRLFNSVRVVQSL
jgi:hypothetical protein